MIEPSPEQQLVIDAPLVPLAVTACAGSGKTATAIQRLVEMRRRLGGARGRIALLSFSNVAVETFRQGYQELSQTLPNSSGRSRVDIDTLDSFMTTHVMKAHGHRTMGANQTAFLVTGGEPFLAGFNCPTRDHPIPVSDIKVRFSAGQPLFYYTVHGNEMPLNQLDASRVVARLGRVGGYTHDLGRYWCYRVLSEQPVVLRALARRYPHIIVDEAQDIGVLHQELLELLIGAGVQVSLIGDPNQAIYEFADADGHFLRNYHERERVVPYNLTRNYRSVPSILSVANYLSGRADDPDRADEPPPLGAYFIGYNEQALPPLLDAFHAELRRQAINPDRSAVVCRAAAMASRLSGERDPEGRGVVKLFAEAAVLRDQNSDFLGAFRMVARGIVSLLNGPPPGLLNRLSGVTHDRDLRELRRRLWLFTRDAAQGLPASSLPASGQWLPLLQGRVAQLLRDIQRDFELIALDGLTRRLTRASLPAGPLSVGLEVAVEQEPKARVRTVHQVKGESIDAVLYVANRANIEAMLAGMNTEVGRIGYVAVTRARDLLWLAVPATALVALRPQLERAGFLEAGQALAG
ncbi:ATP-dependent DNA helicase [Pseudomonas taiwanensis]|uniref:UvrD-helicase domain-containing protein n=1 Tax=Pseudomonas TaxID=286 RepID=UPI0015C03C6E|nr:MULTISPECIES: ATP-dependent helicase [Pseudomonas]MDH4564410.1 ATP-dependent helicase [Pseudomonas sp. BN411]MDH4656740.1 ATP-dependent helicase [Pseudomonas sp. BN606]MDH4874070.1 ATP-dependent helicase [Pseudomonas sp. BN515]NWL75702.1 ATP-dependent DNA helicase [Pseudomonas taiwanensis]